MEHELHIKKLREGLYLLDEGGEATGYLIEGSFNNSYRTGSR